MSQLPDTDPSSFLFDAYRTAVAIRLSETLPLTLQKAYDGVDHGKRGEDFTVALPRFRLPGRSNLPQWFLRFIMFKFGP